MDRPRVLDDCLSCDIVGAVTFFGFGLHQTISGYKGYTLFFKKPVVSKSTKNAHYRYASNKEPKVPCTFPRLFSSF